MPGFRFLALLAMATLALPATLERLTLEEMIANSTAIVRGRVISSWTASRGPVIYTHYRVQVSERWKGSPSEQIEIVVPGGVFAGLRQSFSGTPRLASSAEYVLFLWTGPSGLTHIIGLTQGLFDVKRDSSGALIATRAATSEILLDPASGRPLRDEPLRLKLDDLDRRIRSALGREAVK